jgi:Fe-S-cluster-containing dehydrogenase component
MTRKTIGRRDFLRLGLAGLASTSLGASLVKKKATHGPQEVSPHRWAMVIDQAKCVGCGQCTLACQAYNDTPANITWNRVIEVEPVGEKQVYLPLPCMQCADAPCTDICPVGATYQRADGIIMMDYDRCIGCRYCEMACPYGARYFNWETFSGPNPAVPEWGQPEVPRRPRGVVEKCSFCFNRIDRGLAFGLKPGVDQAATPACVVACPTGARLFGDLNDPNSPVSQVLAQHSSFRLREDLGTEPRVYYLPVRAEEKEEVCS